MKYVALLRGINVGGNVIFDASAHYGPVIFWTAPLKTFGRTRYSKIVGAPAYKFITIRNANTTRKLVELVAKFV